jgi:hypothetical protein
MDYTLKALAQRIATDDSEEAVKTAARRIEHWVSAGLFKLVGVDIGPKALGRGRVRRYPEESLTWCLLWAALAKRGLGLIEISSAAMKIRLKLRNRGRQGQWLRQAMRGEGPALFLFDEWPPGEIVDTWAGNWKLARSPIELDDTWTGGFFINITAIYANAARS